MKDPTTASKTTMETAGGATPFTSPMNLTCQTASGAPLSSAKAVGTPPSQVIIAINPDGPAPGPPDNTWQTFVPAEANVEYDVVDQGDPKKPKWKISGTGVAIYYK